MAYILLPRYRTMAGWERTLFYSPFLIHVTSFLTFSSKNLVIDQDNNYLLGDDFVNSHHLLA